jgi:hypothetical protein
MEAAKEMKNYFLIWLKNSISKMLNCKLMSLKIEERVKK